MYYLAIDGGGTKTHVQLADEAGTILGEGWSGPTNLTATSIGAASFNLREAIRQAMMKLSSEKDPERPPHEAVTFPNVTVSKMVMGLAGLDTPQEAKSAQDVFSKALDDLQFEEFELYNDTIIALESGTDAENAIILISGTGSNCYGKNAAGQEAKAGGMDFLLSDEGSGYWIGHQVLRAATMSFDGRMPPSSLQQAVCDHFRISSVADLKTKIYSPLISKTEVAELAKLAITAAEQGDEKAQQIIKLAVDDLSLMVKTVATKLDLTAKPLDCVLVGGMTKVEMLFNQLEKQLKEFCPQINLIRPDVPPVAGALKMALRK